MSRFRPLLRYTLPVIAIVIATAGFLWLGVLRTDLVPVAGGATCGHACGAGVFEACGSNNPFDAVFDCNGPCNCGLDDFPPFGVPDVFCPSGTNCYYCCWGCIGGCSGGGGGPTNNVQGSHDSNSGTVSPASCTAGGWATDPDDRNIDITVRILIDGVPAISGLASSFRGDLGGVCTGATCAYVFNLWGLPQMTPNVAHTILAQGLDKDSLDWGNLGSSPKTLTCAIPQANIGVTKTDGVTTVVAGSTVTYTVIVTNSGPNAMTGAGIFDALPAAFSAATWTCTASSGSSCQSTSGSGPISSTNGLTVGLSGGITYTVVATLPATAPAGRITNTVQITSGVAFVDPVAGNNLATDSDTVIAQANLSISKTTSATAIPGALVTYTISVSNAGPSAASVVTVTDLLTSAFSSATWTCTASVGSSCGAANGSGNLVTTAAISPSGRVTYTLTALLAPTATGLITNSASVTTTTDPAPTDNTTTITTTLTPQADVAVSKSDGAANAVPGALITYSIVITSAGPSQATGVLSDALPSAISGAVWNCTASVGSTCGVASGAGDVTTTYTVAGGGRVTVTVTALVDALATGTLTNTASITTPIDTTPTNNTATDVDTLTPQAEVQISKSNGVSVVIAGTLVTYTLRVTNTGPSYAPNLVISDALDARLLSATWNCTTTGASTCSVPSGSGDVALSVSLAPNGTATIVVTATLDAQAFISPSFTVFADIRG